jgi:hypothetical protein
MPVMVPGGPYGEDAEMRRRTRYAVVTALSRLGLQAVDAEHVGYFRVPATKQFESLPDTVPYERFTRADVVPMTNVENVVVMWLDASATENPLAGLRTLLQTLGFCAGQRRGGGLTVLGPAGSGDLQAMVSEAKAPGGAESLRGCFARQKGNGRPGVTTPMYSPFATEIPPEAGDALRAAGIEFVQMIASDEALMPSLARELRRRGVDLRKPDQMVAVVSELDTDYGRHLVGTVRAGLCRDIPSATCRERVLRFHYLRGLDGVVPRRSESKESSAPGGKSDAAKPARPSPEDLERAEGQSQFDYLRRLAARVVATQSARPDRRLTAIGVVGTDLYDKLLLLQALRADFPHAVFFTTDLDARLLHPREYRWTRNLIVASSYGLQLREEAQHDAPPFRSNYQTATFLAALTGVISAFPLGHGPVPAKTIAEWIGTPHVFEIGRTEPLHLPDGPGASGRAANWEACRTIVACPQINPDPASLIHPSLPALAWSLLAAILAVVFLSVVSSRVRGSLARFSGWVTRHPGTVLGVRFALLVVVFAVAGALMIEGGEGKPFRFFEGVSLWPTELIRLCAAVAAVGFIIHVERTDSRRRRALQARFFPKLADPVDTPHADNLAHGRGWRSIFAGKPPDDTFIAQGVVDAETQWRSHRYQAAPLAHWTRVTAGSLIFLAFTGSMFFAMGFPHVPFRGAVSFWIDRGVLAISVLALVALIFVVGDAIKLCDKFASCLASPVPNRWPKETRLSFGLADEDSALEAWIDIRMMMEWTETILHFIYFPFVVILLMVVARSGLFDGWDVPWSLIIGFVLSFVCAAACVVILRRAAERLRRFALDRLTRELVIVQGTPSEALVGRKLETMIGEVRELRRGAFAPLSHQPLVSAALLPLSGAGGVALVEYYLLR